MSDKSRLWFRCKIFECAGQFISHPPVVAIQERREFTSRLRNTGVESRCLPSILFL